MENEMSKIHFFNDSVEILNENDRWSTNYHNLPFIMSSLNVSPSSPTQPSLEISTTPTTTTTSDTNQLQSNSNSINNTETTSIEYNMECSLTKRRIIPPRQAKELHSLIRINRRTISKPKKVAVKELNLTPTAVKKLYLDSKKVKSFRPSNLETIFEEPEIAPNDSIVQYLGKKKLKRSLSCSDGLNITKTTIKNRRQRIKKTFGRRFALKKISLDDFYEKLNSNMDDDKINDETEINNLQISNNKSQLLTAEKI